MSLVNVGTKGHIDHSTPSTELPELDDYYQADNEPHQAPYEEEPRKKGKKGKLLKDWE